MADEPMSTDPRVAALLRERDGYVRRGLADRVAAVDADIVAFGGTPPDGGETEPSDAPKGRRTPRSRTAEG